MIQIKNINWYGRQTVKKDWISTSCITNKIYYIHGGNCTYTENGLKKQFEKNSLYLIPFMADFHPFSDENDPLDHSFVDFDIIPPIMSKSIYKLDFSSDYFIKSSVEYFLSIVGSEKDVTYYPLDFKDDVMSILFPIVTLLTNTFINSNNIPLTDNKLAILVMNDLLENVNQEISIKDIAKKYYTSPDVIIRSFKRSFNTTPYAYLKELRLKIAKQLLQSGEKFNYVAQATNYSDASTLAHALKRDKTK